MAKPESTRRGLFRKAEAPNPPPARQHTLAGVLLPLLKPLTKAEPRKLGRPILKTGDPKRDARNKQQRELMAKRRAK